MNGQANALWLAITGLGGAILVIGWFLRGKIQQYDKHLGECNSRAVETGKTEVRLDAAEKQIKSAKTNLHWIGDCIMVLGARLDVKLPQRPD